MAGAFVPCDRPSFQQGNTRCRLALPHAVALALLVASGADIGQNGQRASSAFTLFQDERWKGISAPSGPLKAMPAGSAIPPVP
jgi:hypothetical protein